MAWKIENVEDARLMAAAPDLLDALQRLMDEQNGPPLLRRQMDEELLVEFTCQKEAHDGRRT